jgi:FAD dependent oxidoreductase TIGR03364
MGKRARTIEADVCVIGAGIIGLAHAYEARRRALSVVLLDRNDHAVGASVRNFGHLFFTSVPDSGARRAALARERWLEIGARAGLPLEQSGTLIVARRPDELAVLEAVAGDPERHARMLSAQELCSIAPVSAEGVLGGFHATRDLCTDPRTTVAALASLLDDDAGARVRWGAHVHDVEPGLVHCDGLSVKAQAIVVCPGADYRSLPPALQRGLEPLTLCRLQMLRLRAPVGRRYRPALATGLSLIRYPAFASKPEAAELRARLLREKPALVSNGIHLLVTQRPDGDLIVGDTHAYGDTLAPFDEERLYELLLEEARALLGSDLRVHERWHGIYPTITGPIEDSFLVTAPLPGVRVVQNVAGIGMTLSFGQAPRVLDEL